MTGKRLRLGEIRYNPVDRPLVEALMGLGWRFTRYGNQYNAVLVWKRANIYEAIYDVNDLLDRNELLRLLREGQKSLVLAVLNRFKQKVNGIDASGLVA